MLIYRLPAELHPHVKTIFTAHRMTITPGRFRNATIPALVVQCAGLGYVPPWWTGTSSESFHSQLPSPVYLRLFMYELRTDRETATIGVVQISAGGCDPNNLRGNLDLQYRGYRIFDPSHLLRYRRYLRQCRHARPVLYAQLDALKIGAFISSGHWGIEWGHRKLDTQPCRILQSTLEQ